MSSQYTKPMQPCNGNPEQILFPCLVQEKWDGMKLIIRCLDGCNIEFLGRSMKPIPNQWIVEKLTQELQPLLKMTECLPVIMEGELQAGGRLENCDGMFSAHYREFDDIVFHVFDYPSNIHLSYEERFKCLRTAVQIANSPIIKEVPYTTVYTMDDLMVIHEQNTRNPSLDGTIVRQPDSPYKAGKRTAKEGYVIKLKEFTDMEVLITRVNELMHNGNEGKTNPLGRTERSTAKAGLVPMDTLGSFTCVTDEGVPFNVGSFNGLTADDKKKLWEIRDQLPGKKIKIKFMRLTADRVPFHPVFLAFRDPIDLD